VLQPGLAGRAAAQQCGSCRNFETVSH